jgi:hypothetical protein
MLMTGSSETRVAELFGHGFELAFEKPRFG